MENLENGMVLAQDNANNCYDEIEVTVTRYVKQHIKLVVDKHLDNEEIIDIAKGEYDWENDDKTAEDYDVE